ncbi:helix-turn-helix domain-containing protein [Candidatus Caldatribacterium sp. SIUC1]|uniref:helix-turn-helix domain-containing protein n=1 Tax=Candidatus Caldatribacterium sp. SIUC1 TaxID=3418365 RepID=UPI003F690A50
MSCTLSQPVYEYAVILEPPYPPGWSISPHRHTQHEIGLVRMGECAIQVGERSLRFRSGDVFFFPRGVPHGFTADASSGVAFVVVQFLELERDLLRQLRNTPPIGRFSLFELEVSLFLDICHKLQREIAGGLPFAGIQCKALLSELLVLLLRSASRSIGPYVSPHQGRMVERALQIIHSRYQDDIRIQDLAHELGLSPQHFRELFKRYVGVSPKKYLVTLRLQRSKCMLLHSEYSVTDVALRLGFGSVQQFSKAFRKLTGLSPIEWRKAHAFGESGSVLSSGV